VVSEMLALHFVNWFIAGILAGTEITLHYRLRVSVQALRDSETSASPTAQRR
jgi:hypothetical protein